MHICGLGGLRCDVQGGWGLGVEGEGIVPSFLPIAHAEDAIERCSMMLLLSGKGVDEFALWIAKGKARMVAYITFMAVMWSMDNDRTRLEASKLGFESDLSPKSDAVS